jgi:hypothetical protein
MKAIKSRTLTLGKYLPGSKLVLGGLAIAASAIVGTAGVAAAQHTSDSSSTPSVVAMCKKDFKQLGFKNTGDCVSHENGHGHGYGGDGDHDHDDHHHNHGHKHHYRWFFFGN